MDEIRLETIGSAAAGIAHDINNQLTLIVNHLSLAEVEKAQTAVDRCSNLTASLLSYCRGEAVELCAVDPGVFLRDFTAHLSLPESIDLVLNPVPSLPPIVANPIALMRVLTNLVSNACTAMEDHGTLSITATPRTITVNDSGPGIPAECQSKVFDSFFTTKAVNGAGLGLSIVRELMRQMGGFVTVLSEAGRGARFTLHFRETKPEVASS